MSTEQDRTNQSDNRPIGRDTFEFTVQLTRSDVVALSDLMSAKDKKRQVNWLIAIGVFLGVLAVLAFLLWNASGDGLFFFLGTSAVSVTYIAYALYCNWRWRAKLEKLADAQIVRSPYITLPTDMRISAEGIETRGDLIEQRIRWAVVHGVEEAEDRVFVMVGEGGIIIPKRCLSDEDATSIVEVMNAWRKSHPPAVASCPECGYSLANLHRNGCPECGWNRAQGVVKRWFTRILICFVLGALTTVGVAWGCEWSLSEWQQVDTGWSVERGVSEYDESWIIDVYHSFGATLCESFRERWPTGSFWTDNDTQLPLDVLPSWTQRYQPTAEFRDGTIDEEELRVVAFGLPLRAVSGRIYLPGRSPDLAYYSGYIMPGSYGLPALFLFPGFLIDTFFYGAIWFALLFGFGATRAARRVLRTRRGRCARCGYDPWGQRSRRRDACATEQESPHPRPLSQEERGVVGCPECGWNRERDQSPVVHGD